MTTIKGQEVSVDKSREEFEGWAEEAGALPWGYLNRQRNPSGGYSIQIYTYMWQAWQASRKALVVELPNLLQPGADGPDDWYLHSDPDGEYMKADDVIEALRAAGITVKGEGDEQTNVLSPE